MTSISETPINGGKISFNLPSSIPAPGFNLFQKVRVRMCSPKPLEPQHVFTITGMEFVDPITALVNDTSHGWMYAVNRFYGLTPEQAVDARGSNNEPTEYFRERRLEAVEG